MVIKYDDPTRERDLYVYVPGLRRTTRVGGGNRCDCLGGFVFNMDDSNLWSGDTFMFDWKVLEVKEMLVSALRDWELTKQGKDYIEGAHFTVPIFERRKVWIIEQTPKFKGYCYSKRVYLQDPVTWNYMYMEMYDRAGELWKTEKQNYANRPNPEATGGGGILVNVSGDTLDMKIYEAGPYYHHELSLNDRSLRSETFSIDALRRAGR
jgi:hypothetical protein